MSALPGGCALASGGTVEVQQKVRKALQFEGKELGQERPLIHTSFRTDGVSVFVRDADRLLNVSHAGQVNTAQPLPSRADTRSMPSDDSFDRPHDRLCRYAFERSEIAEGELRYLLPPALVQAIDFVRTAGCHVEWECAKPLPCVSSDCIFASCGAMHADSCQAPCVRRVRCVGYARALIGGFGLRLARLGAHDDLGGLA